MNFRRLGQIMVFVLIGSITIFSCIGKRKKLDIMEKTFEKGTFGYDLKYLSDKDSLVVLKSDNEEAQVIVSAKYQAKVFTSTAKGLKGESLGFVNYKVFDSGVIDEHMNGYGGENRFWLGPEGGQYSIFFESGKEQVYDNWKTPAAIDTEKWNISKASSKEVILTKEMELKNYQGNTFKIAVEREITLLSADEITQKLGVKVPQGVKTVAYATNNRITNKNNFDWTDKTGTVCIWMLDMLNPSTTALTIIPFNEGEEKVLGKIATTDYFGEIPADRIKNKNGNLYLKTDGKYRSKMGLNAKRTKSIAGNYNPGTKLLTIITFDAEHSKTYLNQEWNPKKDPLVGDALNAYNDGPLENGSIMGPFLEVESCSPAAFIKPEESQTHVHVVYHFVGEEAELTSLSEKLLGVSIAESKSIF
jgi:hypothetical protein